MAGYTALLLLASLALSTAAHFNLRGAQHNQHTEPMCERIADVLLSQLQAPQIAAMAQMGLDVRHIIQWATTIDVNNRQQVQDVVCNVIGVDAAQAADYLDSTGILEQLIRRAYDLDIVMSQQMKPMLQVASQHEGVIPGLSQATARLQLRIIALAESTGFTNLDPQGVAESQGYVAMLMAMAQGQGGGPHKRSFTHHKRASTCDETKSIVRELLAVSDPNIVEARQMVGMVSGLNTQDPEFMGQFVCDIFMSSNIRDIVDVLRENNVITNVLTFARSQFGPILGMM
ncbi:hypothetical protein CAPTEDRAFT_224869 [Capitella teleta]|uniref:Uncharacterized protein n=1 Tax=Capitella teleta TaxID=283909 RepID=R7V733_CAPTE|nr:hypothetical protein CAPTEDRAFT_224869 [Capitella teleta]|eukprot:ELU14389.1 hypothetical protein CAPTEDRAFT_224869 [Capitella teleta]